jgi:NTP pyrophosphatase (non-canonical NTP hydrolase)
MSEIQDITTELLKFRDERDWEQFHNAKDLAIALNIESSELLELFLWKPAREADKERIKEELADVLAFSLLLANHFGFDLKKIMLDKIAKNALKYPVDKAKGNSTKYTELK